MTSHNDPSETSEDRVETNDSVVNGNGSSNNNSNHHSNRRGNGNTAAPRLVFLCQPAGAKHVSATLPPPSTTAPAYEEGLEGMENLLVDVEDMDKTGLVL